MKMFKRIKIKRELKKNKIKQYALIELIKEHEEKGLKYNQHPTASYVNFLKMLEGCLNEQEEIEKQLK